MNRISKLAEIPAGSWTKWVVVGFWVVVLVIMAPLSAKLTGAEKNDAKYWLPGNAESTKVLDVQSRFQSPNVYTGVVVYVRASGITAADRAKAAADARRFAGVPGAVPGRIVGPIVSADGKAIETILQVNLGSKGYADANKAVDAIRAITSSNADGLVFHITGPLGGAADSNNVFKSISGSLLYSAVAVVIVILLITYRSPVLWLLPVISSGVALIIAQAVIYLLAAHAGLTVNGLSAGILEVLVFGASTDYALLIVARYREELRRHDRRHPAMATALRRVGPAIIASAATVILALLTLSAAELNSTASLGPVLAIGVAVGMFVMITLLPALLVTFPRGVFWPYRPTDGSAEPTAPGDVGAGRLAHRLPAAAGMDHHRRDPRRAGAGPDRAEGQWPDQRAGLPRASRFGDRRERARRAFPGGRGRAGHRDRQPNARRPRCGPPSPIPRGSPA